MQGGNTSVGSIFLVHEDLLSVLKKKFTIKVYDKSGDQYCIHVVNNFIPRSEGTLIFICECGCAFQDLVENCCLECGDPMGDFKPWEPLKWKYYVSL